MYPSFQNKRYVIKVIIIYVLQRKITDLKIRGVTLVCLLQNSRQNWTFSRCSPTIATRLNAYIRKIR